MAYDFQAESNGHVIGLRRGYDQGYKAGHVAGWNKAILEWETEDKTKWAPLVDRLTAERNEAIRQRDELLAANQHAGLQTQKWRHAFYSMALTLDSAMDVLQAAPQDMRKKVILLIAERAKPMHDGGFINSMPYDNEVVRARAPHIANRLQDWWNQTLAHAKKTADKSPSQGD